MKKIKKVLLLALSLTIVGVVGVSAKSVIKERERHFIYTANGANGFDGDYVMAANDGEMLEDHWFKSGTRPTQFKASLELRTAWYIPNEIVDTSHSVDGYNKTVTTKGREFKTYVESNAMYGEYYLGLKYEN